VFFGGFPTEENQSAPRSTMKGTFATVSTLLIVVGHFQTPEAAGNGGFRRG
jgi:hypothetical protein